MSAPWRTVVVDDAPEMRVLVRALLAESDGEFPVVGEASDGPEGLEVIRRLRPDLVLLDLTMPGMDGLEVLAALGEEIAGMTVLVLSGLHVDAAADAARKAGAAGYLDKNRLVDTLLPDLRAVFAAEPPTPGPTTSEDVG